MKTRASLFAALLGGLALSASACGGDTECGPGTVEIDDACVATEDACAEGTVYDEESGQCVGAACADGTKLEGNECVPDGSVVCGDGSTYDAETGTCVSDLEDCGEGTVEVDGECVPYDDSLVGDVEEMPEPNDLAQAGVFEVPAIGEDVTIKGCVEPMDLNGDGVLDVDYDPYYFQTSGPMLLDVTVDGLNGLSGGFIAVSGAPEIAQTWQRLGVNLVDDKAQRQLYLPTAGVYVLFITDGRSVLTQEAAGGEDTCYFATIEQIAIPDPTPITGDEVVGQLGNEVLFYSYDAVDEGDVLISSVEVMSQAASAGIIGRRNGEFQGSAGFVGQGNPNSLAVAGFAAGDESVLIVDPEVNYAVQPADFTFTVFDPGATLLAEGETAATLTRHPNYYNYAYFDAEAGDVVRLDVSAGTDNLLADVADANLAPVGTLCSAPCAGGADEWVHITEAGRYYLRVYDLTVAAGADYDLTVVRTSQTPEPLALGAPSAQTLADSLTNWYLVDVSNEVWLENATGADTLTDDLRYAWYDATAAGVLGIDVPEITEGEINGPESAEGRIVYETETPMVLVRVEDQTDSSAPGMMFDFGIQQRPFEDLGTINGAEQPAEEGTTLMTDAANRYFLRASDFAETAITISPNDLVGDVVVARLDRDEDAITTANAAGQGGAETLEVTFQGGWIAFEVTENVGVPVNYDLSATYEAPEDYVRVEGELPFATICPDGGGVGSEHDIVSDGSEYEPDDEGISAAPIDISGFGFELFGEPVTDLTVSTNGWLTLSAYSGQAQWAALDMPANDVVNAVVAPYWLDLDDVTVCASVLADSITVEWQGVALNTGTTVEFQAVLHDDFTIDFIYGDDHQDVGATIGIEDVIGARAEVIETGDAGSAAPGTSWRLDLE